MQRSTGYQQVACEEPTEREEPVPSQDSLPSYEQANEEQPQTEEGGANQEHAPNAGSDVLAAPPSYNIATSLPTYEEAELTKQREEEEAAAANQHNQVVRETELGEVQLGTDSVFLCTFIMSFLFNWVGLMASLCFCQSIAGRMGALAGFGLSLVKWVAIAKHNHLIHEVAASDSWIWWLLITMGLLIFLKGCVQYVRIKNQWRGGSQFTSRLIMTL